MRYSSPALSLHLYLLLLTNMVSVKPEGSPDGSSITSPCQNCSVCGSSCRHEPPLPPPPSPAAANCPPTTVIACCQYPPQPPSQPLPPPPPSPPYLQLPEQNYTMAPPFQYGGASIPFYGISTLVLALGSHALWHH